MPNRWAVVILLVLWTAIFQIVGNSTLGYVNTPSVFGWWFWMNSRGAERADGTIDFTGLLGVDEAYGWFIPAVVVFLLWCRRTDLLALPKKPSAAGLGLLILAALLHTLGFMIQQTRISVFAFVLGIYGLTGLLWGGAWMRATFFPFSLLVFCVPIYSAGEPITFPLRLLATKITAGVCHLILGIDVLRVGTQLSDPNGTYQYEVAAACSGIRSLTAAVAFSVIYGYLQFATLWRRLVVLAAAVPLAVAANVFRLTLIVLAAEAFGQRAGDYVHTSSWMSLVPYIPSFGGTLLLGWWLRENRPTARARARVGVTEIEPEAEPKS